MASVHVGSNATSAGSAQSGRHPGDPVHRRQRPVVGKRRADGHKPHLVGRKRSSSLLRRLTIRSAQFGSLLSRDAPLRPPSESSPPGRLAPWRQLELPVCGPLLTDDHFPTELAWAETAHRWAEPLRRETLNCLPWAMAARRQNGQINQGRLPFHRRRCEQRPEHFGIDVLAKGSRRAIK